MVCHDRPIAVIRKIDLQAAPLIDQVVYGSSQNNDFTKSTYGFSLVPKLQFSPSSYINKFKKILNFVPKKKLSPQN